MMDADSIWESKMCRLQDPNLQKMKPLVELMGELREMQIRDPDGLRIVIVEVPETHPLRRR
jgi:hypothetical protein